MHERDGLELDRAYAEVWHSFVTGGSVEPAFVDIPVHGDVLHLVFLIPLGQEPRLAEQAAALQARLDFPHVELIPRELLHVSIQGFNVSRPAWLAGRDELLAAAARVFADEPPFALRLGWPNSFRMAAFLRADDGEIIRRLRAKLRARLPAWAGLDQDPFVQDGRDRWLPHASVAYYNAQNNNGEIVEAITPLREQTFPGVVARQVQLISTPEDMAGGERWVWPVHAAYRLGPGLPPRISL
jgi:hypothetical protein